MRRKIELIRRVCPECGHSKLFSKRKNALKTCRPCRQLVASRKFENGWVSLRMTDRRMRIPNNVYYWYCVFMKQFRTIEGYTWNQAKINGLAAWSPKG